jgi:outer membrane usher protein
MAKPGPASVWILVSALSAAIAPASPAATTAFVVELRINGADSGSSVLVQRDGSGRFHLPLSVLEANRIRFDSAKARMLDGELHVGLADLPGAEAQFDEPGQRLLLTLPAALFHRQNISLARPEPGPMTRSATGFFLNYDLAGEIGDTEPVLTAALELGLFSGRSHGQATALVSWSGAGARAVRLDTSWTFDDPERMRSLRIGDTISRGGVGAPPLRLAGLQFTRSFEVQPGYVTLPMPNLSGSAALPSVAELYVNHALVGSVGVGPGPFTLSGLPVATGSGQTELLVRDALGRESLIRQSYYAAPSLLREGLDDYSYEIGFLRRSYARQSIAYGDFVASATHRLGISNRLTAEAHAEASASVQMIGAGADVAFPGIALAGISGAASRSSDGESGGMVALRVEHRSASLSVGASAEFTSPGYRTLADAGDRLPPATSIRAFAALPTRFGSVRASYFLQDGRGSEPRSELLSANASFRLPGLGALTIAGRKSLLAGGDSALEMFLTVPFGPRTSASASAGVRNGDAFAAAAVQSQAPNVGGWGYRAWAVTGPLAQAGARLEARTDFGEGSAELTWRDGSLGARFVVSGAIASSGSEVFAAQRLSGSFAMVDVGLENVRLYADNHLVGRSGPGGQLVVPWLRPYEDNRLRIELADLPLDAEVTASEINVRPYARSGASASFGARRSRSATLRIVLADGEALPTTATVEVQGRAFAVAPEGQVFLTGLRDRTEIVATWPGGRCRFTLTAPRTDDPQPDLGTHQCIQARNRSSTQ